MAVMDSAGRLQTFKDMLDEVRKADFVFNLSKVNLQEAVDAVDQWVSDNATAYNLAIPQPARNTLTTAQKALLLMVVVGRRYKVGV